MITTVSDSRRNIFALFCTLLAFFILASAIAGPVMKQFYPLKYKELIEKYSALYSLDTYLVMGIISAESGFDSDAVSHKDAKGLMQVRDDTARWCIEKFSIPDYLEGVELNINIGCAYFRYLLDKFQDNTDTALAAYNAGEGNVSRWLTRQGGGGTSLSSIPFSETEHYVGKVNNRRMIYKFLY